MTRNYDRGYAPEAKARETLQTRGFTAWRAWASKGPFDLYAAREDVFLLIQVKRTRSRIVSPDAVATICKTDIHGNGAAKVGMKDIAMPPGCRKQIWLYSDRSVGKDLAGWRYYDLDGDRLVPIPAPTDDWNRDYRIENLAAGLMGGD